MGDIEVIAYVKRNRESVWHPVCVGVGGQDRTACRLYYVNWPHTKKELGAADDICPNCESEIATTLPATSPIESHAMRRHATTLIPKVES